MSNYPKNRNSKSRRLTNEEFIKKLFEVKSKDEYEVLEEYTLSQIPIKFRHNCGREFLAKPNIMLRKNHCGCPDCSIIKRRNTKRKESHNNLNVIEQDVKRLYQNNEYSFVKEKSIYINNKEKTLYLKCNRCGFEFPISLVNLRKERGCPICNKIKRQESKNVLKIKNYLIELNIDFTLEYKDSRCKNIRTLPFDFAIHNGDKLLLIEYDGEFHDNGYNNNKESLKRCKENDEIKTNFCLSNNIPLLRLRYNNFDNYKEKINKFLNV